MYWTKCTTGGVAEQQFARRGSSGSLALVAPAAGPASFRGTAWHTVVRVKAWKRDNPAMGPRGGRVRRPAGLDRALLTLAGERQQYRRRGRGAAGSMLVGAAPVAWWEGGCPSYQTVLRAVLRTVLRTVLRMVLSCPSYCPASCPVLSDCPGGVPGGAAGADWAREPQHTAPSSDAWSEGGHPMLPGAGWGVQTLRLGRIGEWAMGLAARRLHGQARGGSPRVITHYSAVQ